MNLKAECETVTNYEAVWRVLADLMTELRKAGEVVPANVIKDLRSAKTTIEILKVDRENPDHLSRIEGFQASVGSFIMCTAEKRFGPQTVNNWMYRLERARTELGEDTQTERIFFSRVPRDKHWVRIKSTHEISLKRIRSVAEEEGLEHETHKDGYVIVFGDKSRIQNFIKRMT